MSILSTHHRGCGPSGQVGTAPWSAAVSAGDDVLVEQLSTLTVDGVARVSMVCRIFTVEGSKITGMRAHRNDAGLPTG